MFPLSPPYQNRINNFLIFKILLKEFRGMDPLSITSRIFNLFPYQYYVLNFEIIFSRGSELSMTLVGFFQCQKVYC